MRVARGVSALALGVGSTLLAYAALQGQVSVYLLLVVPVVTASGPTAALGALLAVGGLVAWLWTGLAEALEAPEKRDGPERGGPGEPSTGATEPEGASETSTRGGGILLLGPIPVAWGTERGSLLALVVAATVLLLVALAASLLLA